MSSTASSLDLVDQAFLRHRERTSSRASPSLAASVTDAPVRPAATAAKPAAGRPAIASTRPRVTTAPSPPAPLPTAIDATACPTGDGAEDGDGIVPRLVRAAAEEWEWVARRVEEARREGTRVVAVAGGRRGEGRTTVVRCLARVLAARGWRVTCHDVAPIDAGAGRTDDGENRRIDLVDAGVWFPGGPLRRSWLERQSLGCPAVILVRGADQPECPARGPALEAVGVKVLGEVITRVPVDAGAAR